MFKIMLFSLFFSCCFAQSVEKIFDQDDNILPRSKLMDGNNVEEILKQLSGVLVNDLRQTSNIMADMQDMKTEMVKIKDEFTDIKTEIADIKEYIVRNEGKIVDNSNTITEVNIIAERNSDQVNKQDTLTMNNIQRLNSMTIKMVEIVDIKDKMADMEDIIVKNSDNISDLNSSMSEEVKQQDARIESLKNSDQEQETRKESDQHQAAQIQNHRTRGTWCGYKGGLWSKVGTMTYDSLTFSDTNMEITRTPLDINTGNYSNKCYYYLYIDICHISGIFTVPLSGVWKVTFSMRSWVHGDANWAYLYINGNQVEESLQVVTRWMSHYRW